VEKWGYQIILSIAFVYDKNVDFGLFTRSSIKDISENGRLYTINQEYGYWPHKFIFLYITEKTVYYPIKNMSMGGKDNEYPDEISCSTREACSHALDSRVSGALHPSGRPGCYGHRCDSAGLRLDPIALAGKLQQSGFPGLADIRVRRPHRPPARDVA
jgi:hypothetical protein